MTMGRVCHLIAHHFCLKQLLEFRFQMALFEKLILAIFQVYIFDPKEPKETKGCCVRQRTLREEFPAAEGSKPLPDNLDSVYYSYKDSAMYFIRDEDVWQNVLFHPRQKHVKNSVKYLGKWYEKWFDICDVTTHSTYMFEFNSKTW